MKKGPVRGWILAAVILVFGSELSHCLRNVRLHMPNAVQRGHGTVFQCLFDMEGDSLYSVKWYKGTREFYRYIPTDRPPHKYFPVPGHEFKVDYEKSNASHLFLGPVDSSVGGRYSCEVSADAPSFHTALVSGETNVVEIPSHTPMISGIKPKYRLGDVLKGNCTSRDSKPAANLTWFINDQPRLAGDCAPLSYIPDWFADLMVCLMACTPRDFCSNAHAQECKTTIESNVESKYVKPLRKIRVGHRDLETAQLGLRFTIARHHFEHGRLKIRCTASMYNLYWKTTEKSVDEEKPKLNIYNAVTPNTLGVNQLPSPYDFYQPSQTYFDEDFPEPIDRRRNNVLFNPNIVQEVPTAEDTPSSSAFVQWSTSSVLLTCALAAHFV